MADDVESPAESVGDEGLPISLRDFATLLRPQAKRNAEGRVIGLEGPGHADEIWLKYLSKQHRFEKHSETGWRNLIDGYRGKPAHSAGMQ